MLPILQDSQDISGFDFLFQLVFLLCGFEKLITGNGEYHLSKTCKGPRKRVALAASLYPACITYESTVFIRPNISSDFDAKCGKILGEYLVCSTYIHVGTFL